MIYEFKCKECGKQEEFILTLSQYEMFTPPPCKVCLGEIKRSFSNPQPVRSFKPDWYRDIALDPIWITSKKQLKEECEKHGGISRHVEDSYNRNY